MPDRIIHMMYFPWDGKYRLRPDDEDFDHGPVDRMRRYAPDFDVRLWTYTRTRDFCRTLYPSIWNALEKCPHPVMLVDVLRWVVVHHFGGIYWQTTVTPLAPMETFLPKGGRGVRLFTEKLLTPDQCRIMAPEPIRQGEPEESVRILIGAFSARPQTRFIEKLIALLLERLNSHAPRNDYDILYITGNAAASTAYARFGQDDPDVERVDLERTRRQMKVHYHGGWRSAAPARPAPQPGTARPRTDCMPFFRPAAALAYRLFRRHPHEAVLDRRDAARLRAGIHPALPPVLRRLEIDSVCEAPCGRFEGPPPPVPYTGIDPRKPVIQSNRNISLSGCRFLRRNLLYSRLPRADLIICPDFPEWLSFPEVRRVLARLRTAPPRYLALTTYPLLNENWDAATGDFRPIDFRLAPFGFPAPETEIPLPPLPAGRPDRSLAVWPCRDPESAPPA